MPMTSEELSRALYDLHFKGYASKVPKIMLGSGKVVVPEKVRTMPNGDLQILTKEVYEHTGQVDNTRPPNPPRTAVNRGTGTDESQES